MLSAQTDVNPIRQFSRLGSLVNGWVSGFDMDMFARLSDLCRSNHTTGVLFLRVTPRRDASTAPPNLCRRSLHKHQHQFLYSGATDKLVVPQGEHVRGLSGPHVWSYGVVCFSFGTPVEEVPKRPCYHILGGRR